MGYLIRRLTITAATVGFAMLPMAVHAADILTVQAADPTEQGTGSAAMRGALPKSADEVEAKAAATHASQALGQASGGSSAAAGPLATISGGHNFAGQFVTTSSPPDTTGAIGTTRYIETVNTRFGIYNRSTNALIGSGTLNQLAGQASTVNTFDPQIIWDAYTNRFYYVNDSIFTEGTDNRLSFGFSKTASPNGAADFCHYNLNFGTRFPDYPKLGDSAYFMIIGVNAFNGTEPEEERPAQAQRAGEFLGSDIIAVSKPPSGTTCPAATTFKANVLHNIKDTAGNAVFTPVPANQIDASSTGYVVARNGSLPSTKLWFRSITRNSSTGFAVYGGPRGATVASYTFPPNAPGGVNSTVLLDTLDARNTQAVQSINPDRGTFSFWVQHTINVSGRSAVRWYEINPVPATPVTAPGEHQRISVPVQRSHLVRSQGPDGLHQCFRRQLRDPLFRDEGRLHRHQPADRGRIECQRRGRRLFRHIEDFGVALSGFHLQHRYTLPLGRLCRSESGPGPADHGPRRRLGREPVECRHLYHVGELAHPDLRPSSLNDIKVG